MKRTVKKLPKSEISVAVSIPEDVFESYRKTAIENLGAHVEIAGFRKGKAPSHILEKELRAGSILEEMAGLAVSEHLPKILVEEKIDAIGRPMIQITKIAQGNPLEFTATVAVLPEVKLPDYKKIAAKAKKAETDITVDDAELEKAIIELKRARKHQKMHDENVEHNHEDVQKEEMDATLTDEYVKELGPFENIEDFKTKFRENILHEKKAREQEKRRVEILEAITKETEVEVPGLLVESEQENLLARLKSDIAQAGISFEEYLKHIQKSEDDIRKDMLPDAEKRAKVELIMHKIGETEKLQPKEEDIENETKRLIQTYQKADPTRIRAYVTHQLSNEAILRFLENLE